MVLRELDSTGSGLNLTAGYTTTACLQAGTGRPDGSAGSPHTSQQIHFPQTQEVTSKGRTPGLSPLPIQSYRRLEHSVTCDV